MNTIELIDAYVKLLDEGLDVWRPCRVIMLHEFLGVVASYGFSFENSIENWECKPGDLVTLFPHKGKVYVSHAEYNVGI